MRRLPRLGEVVRQGEVVANPPRVRVRDSVWVDSRPSRSLAHDFAESLHQSAKSRIHVIELRVDQAADESDGPWVASSLAELSMQIQAWSAGREHAAYVFWGDIAGQLIEPDLVVRLGPPRLFLAASPSHRVIGLPAPHPEVVAAIARELGACSR